MLSSVVPLATAVGRPTTAALRRTRTAPPGLARLAAFALARPAVSTRYGAETALLGRVSGALRGVPGHVGRTAPPPATPIARPPDPAARRHATRRVVDDIAMAIAARPVGALRRKSLRVAPAASSERRLARVLLPLAARARIKLRGARRAALLALAVPHEEPPRPLTAATRVIRRPAPPTSATSAASPPLVGQVGAI